MSSPTPETSQTTSRWSCGTFCVRADFDSANVASCIDGGVHDGRQNVHVIANVDAHDTGSVETSGAKPHRSWYYFSVEAPLQNSPCSKAPTMLDTETTGLTLAVHGLRGTKLYKHGMLPCVRISYMNRHSDWMRLDTSVCMGVLARSRSSDSAAGIAEGAAGDRVDMEDDSASDDSGDEQGDDSDTYFKERIPADMKQIVDDTCEAGRHYIHFDFDWARHLRPVLQRLQSDLPSDEGTETSAAELKHIATVSFAMCPPFSCTDLEAMLKRFDDEFASEITLPDDAAEAPSDGIYYHRELLTHSLEGRRVDLLTISSMKGLLPVRLPRFAGLFPHKETKRSQHFHGKKVFFISARVHPGETPGSHMLNGILHFLLKRDDPRAASLRDTYVFKIVPMLNPDGVYRGHYRYDTRSVNLNRHYNSPSPEHHPTIFAAKAVVLFHHLLGPAPSPRQPSARVRRPSPVVAQRSAPATGSRPSLGEQLSPATGERTSSSSAHAVPRVGRSAPHHQSRQGHSDDPNGTRPSHPGASPLSPRLQKPPTHLQFIRQCHQRSKPAGPEIKESESGVAFYIDLHAHASKKGCFAYGNCLAGRPHIENIVYAKLASLNSPDFSFEACNFTEKNMFQKDKSTGETKDGSGRVGMFFATNIPKCFTIESHYFTGKSRNLVARVPNNAQIEQYSSSADPIQYGVSEFEDMGRSLLLGALDSHDDNPWSRLPYSDMESLRAVRDWAGHQARSGRLCKASSQACRGKINLARRGLRQSLLELEQRLLPAIEHMAPKPQRQSVPQRGAPQDRTADHLIDDRMPVKGDRQARQATTGHQPLSPQRQRQLLTSKTSPLSRRKDTAASIGSKVPPANSRSKPAPQKSSIRSRVAAQQLRLSSDSDAGSPPVAVKSKVLDPFASIKARPNRANRHADSDTTPMRSVGLHRQTIQPPSTKPKTERTKARTQPKVEWLGMATPK